MCLNYPECQTLLTAGRSLLYFLACPSWSTIHSKCCRQRWYMSKYRFTLTLKQKADAKIGRNVRHQNPKLDGWESEVTVPSAKSLWFAKWWFLVLLLAVGMCSTSWLLFELTVAVCIHISNKICFKWNEVESSINRCRLMGVDCILKREFIRTLKHL